MAESYKVNKIKKYRKREQKMDTKREITAQDEVFFFTCIGWILVKCHALYVALFIVKYCHCLNDIKVFLS